MVLRSAEVVGVVRIRRSIEMAAQENIRLGLEKLASADLSGRSRATSSPLEDARPEP